MKLKKYYEDLEQLLDWEGGLEQLFIYHGCEEGVDPKLDKLVNEMSDSREKLVNYLESKGVHV